MSLQNRAYRLVGALPPQRRWQRALQPVRWQLHPRCVHDRDRRGSLSEDQGRDRDGLDHRRRNARHGGDSGTAQATSGLINPGFKNKVLALQVNPFVKFRGLEVFGVIEQAEGKSSTEVAERTFKQYAVDTVYRFLPNDQLFVGVRYNKAYGDLPGITGDAGAKRWQIGGGWFIMPGLLAKAEYVDQKYVGYPAANIKNGGHFKGVMLEGVVAF